MSEVNIVAVVVSAVASIALGMAWYGPWFGKKWMHLLGLSKEKMKEMSMKPQTAMALGLLVALITSYVFALVLKAFMAYTLMEGWTAAIWVWLGFSGAVSVAPVLWEGKPWKLFFIQGGYYLVALLVSATILILWN